ncbi:MAG TPA: kelch repeat-containing protein [Frankiaceae bacterium]|nr:kelch repeat-containing protein [Frankiaceae bacterium]
MRRVAAIVVAALVLVTPAFAGSRPAPRWKTLAAMTEPRHEGAYAVAGGKVYAVGGFVVSLTNSVSVDVYDPKADRWSAGPPIPSAVNHAMSAALGDDVYVAGGYSAVVFGAVNTAFVLRDGTWLPIAPMPETRAAGAMVAYGGKLWIYGGFTQQGVLATTALVYDPKTGLWSTGQGLPTPREHLTAVTDGRSVWALGGRNGSPDTNTALVERLDVPTGRWYRVPGLLQTRSGHVSALTSTGFLVSAGGEHAGGVFDSVEAYDTRTGRRLRLPRLAPGRTGFGGVALGSRFLVFSGAGDAGYLAATEALDLRR